MFDYIVKCWNGEEKYWKVFILGSLIFSAITVVLVVGLFFLSLLLHKLMPDSSETIIIIFAYLFMISSIIPSLCWIILCWHCPTGYFAKTILVIMLLPTASTILNYKQTINGLVFMQISYQKLSNGKVIMYQKDYRQESIEQVPAPEDKLLRNK